MCQRGCGICTPQLKGLPREPGAQTQVDQVGCPRIFDQVEGQGAGEQDGREAQGGHQHVHHAATLNAQHAGHPRRSPLRGTAGHDIQHRRPRDQKQPQAGQGKHQQLIGRYQHPYLFIAGDSSGLCINMQCAFALTPWGLRVLVATGRPGVGAMKITSRTLPNGRPFNKALNTTKSTRPAQHFQPNKGHVPPQEASLEFGCIRSTWARAAGACRALFRPQIARPALPPCPAP